MTKKLAENKENAIELMAKNPSMIKRPIILGKNVKIIGFSEVDYVDF